MGSFIRTLNPKTSSLAVKEYKSSVSKLLILYLLTVAVNEVCIRLLMPDWSLELALQYFKTAGALFFWLEGALILIFAIMSFNLLKQRVNRWLALFMMLVYLSVSTWHWMQFEYLEILIVSIILYVWVLVEVKPTPKQ